MHPVDSKLAPIPAYILSPPEWVYAQTKMDQTSDTCDRGVLTDKDLGPVLYYHYYSLAAKQAGGTGVDGYLYGWNELDFSTGWPVVKAI